MFKYGGQVERISQKSYYTVLQQKTKKHSCCDDHHFCFHLFILFVCDSKTKKLEKYTYQNFVQSCYALHVLLSKA